MTMSLENGNTNVTWGGMRRARGSYFAHSISIAEEFENLGNKEIALNTPHPLRTTLISDSTTVLPSGAHFYSATVPCLNRV